MQLQSPAFLSGNTIPLQYTCDGDNFSPSLSWENPPPGTASYALIVEDPDAPKQTFTHWIVYDLPFTVKFLPEGVNLASADSFAVNLNENNQYDFIQLIYYVICGDRSNRWFKLIQT